MSLLSTAEVLLLNAASNVLLGLPKSNTIGGVQIDTTLEEFYEDRVEVTRHPVEAGAQITDHSYKEPMELILSCGWSDSSLSGLSAAVGNLTDSLGLPASLSGGNPAAGVSGSFTGGAIVASDYVAGVYSLLLAMQEAREPVVVVSGLRSYHSMIISSLRVRRDQKNRYALVVLCTFTQVILVDTQPTTVPPRANQAIPANTADVVNTGAQQAQQATPSTGGSYPVQ